MNTWVSKILLPLYLFAALTPQQLRISISKLPFLVQHFNQHVQEEKNTSLTAFIIEHYGKGFAKHSSEHNHSQLPGKGEHNSAHSIENIKAFLTVLPSTPFKPTQYFSKETTRFIQTSQLLPSAHLSSIWQPPKA